MGWNVDVIARPHLNGLVFFLKHQPRRSSYDDHPLVLVLIVPEVLWTGMPRGDDSFDADVLILGEDFNEFLGKICWQVSKEVTHLRVQ